jgi:hypothetical protein
MKYLKRKRKLNNTNLDWKFYKKGLTGTLVRVNGPRLVFIEMNVATEIVKFIRVVSMG